jgi:excinuclease ABC subunit C
VDLNERALALPNEPGVYLFKNARGAILYIGKAQNLRARVRSYLAGGDGRYQIPALIERARDVDVVVTHSVKDALLLENELIKRHKPPFNVRLRDDKQYLALRLDTKADWPRLTQVRKFRDDGALYFGPYTSSSAMRDATSNLRRIFPLRSCSNAVFRDYRRRGRPCIEFQMKRCLGPCCDRVDAEPYAQLVNGTILFLKGRSDELVQELGRRMREAGDAERFEEAAILRDQIARVERTVERQQIVGDRPIDRDVFGLARDGGEACVQVLHVREGRVIGAQDYSFSDVRLDDCTVIGSFLGQYYGTEHERQIPSEVLTPDDIGDDGGLQSLLADTAGRKVGVRAPKRGPMLELVRMANHNAELSLARRLEAKGSIDAALAELQERLSLSVLPRRVEGYDVSTLHGTLTVACRVAFENGRPNKQKYRRYRIKQAALDDDYAAMREVFRRRLARADTEPLPDLFLVDGGKGHLGVLCAALADAGHSVDAVGISKERDLDSPSTRVRRGGGLKAERLYLPGRRDPVLLPPSSRGLLYLQHVRDESHRFAIEFQRSLRSRQNFTSILEELPGIGPAKRRALLRELGSLRAVKEASLERLHEVAVISEPDALAIHTFFRDLAAAELPEAEPPAVETPAVETPKGS